jgi:hypothetical protein
MDIAGLDGGGTAGLAGLPVHETSLLSFPLGVYKEAGLSREVAGKR